MDDIPVDKGIVSLGARHNAVGIFAQIRIEEIVDVVVLDDAVRRASVDDDPIVLAVPDFVATQCVVIGAVFDDDSSRTSAVVV